MNLTQNFATEVIEQAYEEVARLHGIDLRKEKISSNATFNHQLIKSLIQATTFAAIINYHMELRDELLKHGIDIGELKGS